MLTMQDRADHYNASPLGRCFPASRLWVYNNVIYGMWMLGNNYRVKSRFYGGYPNGLLPRLHEVFPDRGHHLHLFSGALPPSPDYTRFDVKQEADVQGDAATLSKYFRPGQFHVTFADPPYTTYDADKYGTPLVGKFKVVCEVAKITRRGGFLVWLDQSHPMYRREEWRLAGLVGIVRSTNHKYRVVSIFERT